MMDIVVEKIQACCQSLRHKKMSSEPITSSNLISWLKKSKIIRHSIMRAFIRLSIARQVRALRLSRGWTQQRLALELGVKQGTVSSLENPRGRDPSLSTLYRVACVFDVAIIIEFIDWGEAALSMTLMPSGSLIIEFAENGDFKRVVVDREVAWDMEPPKSFSEDDLDAYSACQEEEQTP